MNRLVIAAVLAASAFALQACSSSSCGPSNCAGCCDATNTCQPPAAQTCGVDGSACAACSGAQQCVLGVCEFPGGNGNGNGNGSGNGSSSTSASNSASGSSGTTAATTATNGSTGTTATTASTTANTTTGTTATTATNATSSTNATNTTGTNATTSTNSTNTTGTNATSSTNATTTGTTGLSNCDANLCNIFCTGDCFDDSSCGCNVSVCNCSTSTTGTTGTTATTSTTSTSTSTTTGTTGTTSSTTTGTSGTCTEIQLAGWAVDPNAMSNFDSTVSPNLGSASIADIGTLQFYPNGSGAYSSPGIISLSTGLNANFSSCTECVLLLEDPDPSTGAPVKTFFQQTGSLNLSALDATAGTVSATISDSRLIEVTIDPTTYASTPVSGGACLHVVSSTVLVQ